MSEKLHTNDISGKHDNSSGKKPYAPPRILSKESLESAANVCTGFGQKSQPSAPAPGGGLCGQSGLQS